MMKRALVMGAVALVGLACGGPGKSDAGTGGGGGGGSGGGTGGGTGGGGGGSVTSVNQFATAWAGQLCDKLIACNRAESSWKDGCTTLYSQFLAGDLVQSVASGEQSFDPAAANACLQQMQSSSGDCDDLYSGLSCGGYVSAQVPSGGQCNHNSDCATLGDSCRYGPDAGSECEGKCQGTGGLDEPCSGSSCDQGYWCEPATSLCRAPQGPGASCNSTSTYNPQCDPATSRCDTTAGQCVALPGAGSTCDTNYPYCASSAFCNYAGVSPYQCVARGGADAGCTSGSQCESAYFCSASTNGRCTPLGAQGASCTSTTQCQTPLRCNGGSCQPRSPENGPCRASGDCVSGLVCDDVSWSCKKYTYVSAGSPCTNAVSCRDSYCDGKVSNTDGGAGTPGTCNASYPGRRCSGYWDCRNGTYCQTDGGSTSQGSCALSSIGSPCGSSENCATSAYCADLPDAGNGCVARAGAGQSCDPTSTASCTSGYLCLTSSPDAGVGQCGIPGSTGTPCVGTGDSQCKLPNQCIEGQCTLVGGPGQPCTDDGVCFAGLCEGFDAGVRGTCGATAVDGTACQYGMQCQSGTCDRLAKRCIAACQ